MIQIQLMQQQQRAQNYKVKMFKKHSLRLRGLHRTVKIKKHVKKLVEKPGKERLVTRTAPARSCFVHEQDERWPRVNVVEIWGVAVHVQPCGSIRARRVITLIISTVNKEIQREDALLRLAEAPMQNLPPIF